ncbi:hypothetical protein HDU98_005761 [Podochytrium sp. JEL0797]|nr:hypothetical protein HDU98_005761 [Podochytrium sp. JEL0797]
MFDPVTEALIALNPAILPSDPRVSNITAYAPLYFAEFYICYPLFCLASLVNGYILAVVFQRRAYLFQLKYVEMTGGEYDQWDYVLWNCIARVAAVMDCLVTPSFILYFHCDIRAMFWQMN